MKRKDEWNANDDFKLAEMVLSYIKYGKSQLQAFDDVGEKLGRTPAACGFRWNSNVRHKYKDAIYMAKMEKLNSKIKSSSGSKEKSFSFDDVIAHLLAAKDGLQHLEREKEVIRQKIQNVSLEIENKRSEMNTVTLQNTQALAKILSKAADLGLFEHNKKPAI
ncbi:hypothetical protein [Paenibacillus xylanexedens]|uniref:hypothetical protein n=1 Tax=Paenibacillus xylanexedens TaxID=528191 RepID=UPI000F53CBA8|nr:hypothetical protein [Paenibacillus xylanexedens]RPK31811.1 hypothetical protein EDO6_02438 [Paenibacillus xylanexedens]